MTNEQEIVWLAGLLEGEGCFSIRRDTSQKHRNTERIEVHLLMTDEDVVKRAATIMKASTVTCSADKRPNCKDRFSARIRGDKAASLMRQILPFMGIRRKAKIEEALTRWDKRMTISRALIQRHARAKSSPGNKNLFVIEGAA